MMEKNGRVVMYEDRGAYGFLEVADLAWRPTGERLFFHLNGYRRLERISGTVQLVSQRLRIRSCAPGEVISPGVQLVFERGQGSRGIQARLWALASAAQRLEAAHSMRRIPKH